MNCTSLPYIFLNSLSQKTLDRGTFGIVSSYLDKQLNKLVAIKSIQLPLKDTEAYIKALNEVNKEMDTSEWLGKRKHIIQFLGRIDYVDPAGISTIGLV